MSFDATNFMNAVFNEANDTKLIPCPAGEFQVQITKCEPTSGTIGKGDRTGETWAALKMTLEVNDEGVKALCGRDKVFIGDMVLLDLTPSGGLDMSQGKNIRLGRVREACGLNKPGQPFSPAMLTGQMVKVSVKHVPGLRDPNELVAEVTGYAKPY